METVCVYVDILFFFNFVLNLIILFLTGFATGQKPQLWRAIAGSVGGSIYVCVLYLANSPVLTHVLFRIVVSVGMIWCVFGCIKVTEFLKTLIVYYLMNFMLAGGIRFSGGFFFYGITRITWVAVLSGLVILFFCGEFYFYTIKKNIVGKEKYISLYYNGKQMELKAFSDTGNTLTEPLEHLGVIVVKSSKLRDFISFEHPETVKNFRLIPCSTVTEETGILYGFKPDGIFCDKKCVRAVVAASDTLQMEGYDAIVNPIVLL